MKAEIDLAVQHGLTQTVTKQRRFPPFLMGLERIGAQILNLIVDRTVGDRDLNIVEMPQHPFRVMILKPPPLIDLNIVHKNQVAGLTIKDLQREVSSHSLYKSQLDPQHGQ